MLTGPRSQLSTNSPLCYFLECCCEEGCSVNKNPLSWIVCPLSLPSHKAPLMQWACPPYKGTRFLLQFRTLLVNSSTYLTNTIRRLRSGFLKQRGVHLTREGPFHPTWCRRLSLLGLFTPSQPGRGWRWWTIFLPWWWQGGLSWRSTLLHFSFLFSSPASLPIISIRSHLSFPARHS